MKTDIDKLILFRVNLWNELMRTNTNKHSSNGLFEAIPQSKTLVINLNKLGVDVPVVKKSITDKINFKEFLAWLKTMHFGKIIRTSESTHTPYILYHEDQDLVLVGYNSEGWCRLYSTASLGDMTIDNLVELLWKESFDTTHISDIKELDSSWGKEIDACVSDCMEYVYTMFQLYGSYNCGNNIMNHLKSNNFLNDEEEEYWDEDLISSFFESVGEELKMSANDIHRVLTTTATKLLELDKTNDKRDLEWSDQIDIEKPEDEMIISCEIIDHYVNGEWDKSWYQPYVSFIYKGIDGYLIDSSNDDKSNDRFMVKWGDKTMIWNDFPLQYNEYSSFDASNKDDRDFAWHLFDKTKYSLLMLH